MTLRNWWSSLHAGSTESLRRDLRNLLRDLTEIDELRDGLAERRDRLIIDIAAMETPHKQAPNVISIHAHTR